LSGLARAGADWPHRGFQKPDAILLNKINVVAGHPPQDQCDADAATFTQLFHGLLTKKLLQGVRSSNFPFGESILKPGPDTNAAINCWMKGLLP
jgi:hypothetical protein